MEDKRSDLLQRFAHGGEMALTRDTTDAERYMRRVVESGSLSGSEDAREHLLALLDAHSATRAALEAGRVCINCRTRYCERENVGQMRCYRHAHHWSDTHTMWVCCKKRRLEAMGCMRSDHVEDNSTDARQCVAIPMFLQLLLDRPCAEALAHLPQSASGVASLLDGRDGEAFADQEMYHRYLGMASTVCRRTMYAEAMGLRIM